MSFYQKSVEESIKQLNSNKELWLTPTQWKKNQEKFGKNILTQHKKINPRKVLLNQFRSFLIGILIIAAIISFFVGEHIEAIVIGIIILLNAILGFTQEYNAEKAIENLRDMASLKARVLRNWKEELIDSEELTLGDILIIEAGDKIGADARIIESHTLEAAEAVLTGESLPVLKHTNPIWNESWIGDQNNMIFAGTSITKGRWMAIVTAIGMETEIGKIAGMIQEAPEKQTKLQGDLNTLSKRLGIVILWICILVFCVNVFLLNNDPQESFLTAIALSVAAIPEWLPAVVTISLGIGVKKLVKKQALVKKLGSVETLGSVNIICTDKTGTLTQNEMTVKKCFVNNKIVEIGGIGYTDIKKEYIAEKNDTLETLLRIGILCNNSEIDEEGDIIGDPTEVALLVSGMKYNLDQDDEENKYLFMDELPFDSERKLMTTLRKKGKQYMVYTKGAPEEVLQKCTHILLDGEIQKLEEKERKLILNQNQSFAQEALRVLWFAYKEITSKKPTEEELIFVGLQAMIDPPRKEVKSAIATCKKAGIRVVMITGDNAITAQAIAKELWIQGEALSGIEVEKMSDKTLKQKIDSIGVFARVSPHHKQRIIKILKQKGNVVAMTGDGVNDAPALKHADIGLAMGITGTEVTKEASDMILMDDNFTTIVNAVQEGRGIYNNIKKFVNFLLATNFAEIIIIFMSIIFGLPLPLIAIQILWINLISDGLPALALGIDPYDSQIMNKKPRKNWSKIVDNAMIKSILLLAGIISIGCLGFFMLHYQTDITIARTGVFSLLIIVELVVIQIIRREYGVKFWSNKRLFLAIWGSILLTLSLIYIPALANIFKLKPLSLGIWLEIIGIIAIISIGSFIYHKLQERIKKE